MSGTPTVLIVAPCDTMFSHLWHLMMWGRCGCWDEGRNRSAYWGWKGANDAE